MCPVQITEQVDSDCFTKILNAVDDGIYFLNSDRVITYWNKAAEAITGFTAEEVVGSKCSDNILLHIDTDGNCLCKASTCPAFCTIKTGKSNNIPTVYLHHKDGHRIPVSVHTTPIRTDDGDIVGAAEVFSEHKNQEQLHTQLEELRKLALLDPLTSVGNRRFGQMRLLNCTDQFARYNWPFGILLCNIDNFKKINDSIGHDFGDKVLKMVAQTLAANVRSLDHVIRWGGEEFVVIVVNIQPLYLHVLAQKLRILVENSYILNNLDKVKVTLSIGATYCKHDDNIDSIIQRADQLMYKSKNSGQNCVCCE
jgi:diguanylate cyclase (GGDEF)-like protein/PAS domain S-box-containing protein